MVIFQENVIGKIEKKKKLLHQNIYAEYEFLNGN